MQKKCVKLILNILLLFVILQPFFDILSNLYIEGIINFGISTYIKPLIIFVITLYLFMIYRKQSRWWLLYGISFCIFIVLHCLLLKKLFVDNATILHEVRFMINIIYMILLYFNFSTVYKNIENKKEFLIKLKKTIALTFLLYCGLLLLSVITKTSGLTYEYADANKMGFKGWYDSGQILGHTISIMFPILLYTLLKPRFKWYYRVLFIFPIIITVSILGTKVPYYIVLITLIIYLIISLYNRIFNKYYKLNIFNLTFVIICIFGMFLTYKYTPLYHNTIINQNSLSKEISDYDDNQINIKETLDYYDKLILENSDKNIEELIKYSSWVTNSNNRLKKLYENKIIHPSEIRKKQFHYSLNMYIKGDYKYKLLGVGYLNQLDQLSLEIDFFMAIFAFGAVGFILFLFIPIKEFVKSTFYMLKNIKTNDLETYLLYAGFGIFFCISIFAGYTYIYTNFSIFLVMLMMMLKCKININETYKKENRKVKKISFLLLHLGYGGIETATINTANALTSEYEVELISFYKLTNSQDNKLNENVKIKYLYNGGPNKEELFSALKKKNIVNIFKEGVKTIDILIKKKILIIREIIFSKSDVLISTRVDFSVLLNKYGATNKIKIAQEHHHHNNNKKYIDKLKYRYDRIDYLLALTKSLKKDYTKFLTQNSHTKIIYLPNMIISNQSKKSNLKEVNIISVGRLHKGKRIDELINIFSKIDNKKSKLFIIGDGEEKEKLNNLIKDLNLSDRVMMLGFLNLNEQIKYYKKSSVFAMTSESEGLPMVLLEAMQFGVPCIAYETDSGTNDIIDNNSNGFVIKNRNEKAYISKMNKLLNDFELRKKMSLKALQTVNNFSEIEVLKIWNKIFK